MKKIIPITLTIVALVGCATDTVESLGPAPKHMNRVQFIQYDTAVRTPNPNLVVLNKYPEDRKYKVIAHMTCEGAYHEEIVMTQALIYEAKKLGADAMVRIQTTMANTKSGVFAGTRSLFKADAIVFEKP